MSKDIKENQIISIVGATATGKTAFALDLAAFLLANSPYRNIHLLSADSRQVYQGLENLTGADLPTDFATATNNDFSYPCFTNPAKNIFLHGVAIIKPTEEWSVAHFKKIFENIKKNLSAKDFLIVVGGTGFYQQQIFQSAESIYIPQNKNLRIELEKLTVKELQKKLQKLNQKKLKEMNNSDLNNPRRLLRAIEIITFENKTKKIDNKTENNENQLPIFYLELPKEIREQKIKDRVVQRFDLAKKEVETQLQKSGGQNLPAFSSTGFGELKKLLQKEIDQKTCINLWQTAEIQYAKRQDTWWKKQNNLISINKKSDLRLITDKILQACYI